MTRSQDVTSANGGLPVPEVSDDPATRAFWDGIRQGRLLLEQCLACRAVIWYPRGFCPGCGSAATEWIAASGHGSVYSYTVARKSFGTYAAVTPYVIAYVELEEGPRVLSNVIDVAPGDMAIGMRVEAVFESDGERLAYRFRPATAEETAHE